MTEHPGAKGSAVLRAWRGEIGLYRAAYGLGGVGLSLVALLGDTVLGLLPESDRLATVLIGLGEIGFAGFVLVATQRAARRGRPDGRPYGRIAVALALAFTGLQFVLTIAWVLLSALGDAPAVTDAVARWMIGALGGDTEGLDQLLNTLGTPPP